MAHPSLRIEEAMMMRSLWLAATLPCLAVITGCPLSTDVPLAQPQDGLRDDRLIGDWVAEDREGGSSRILVLPFNRNEYYVEIADEDEPTRYRVYVFAAGGERLLHIEELSPDRDHPEYIFARWEMTDGSHLTVKPVGDELVKADAGPAAIVDFLARNADDPALYDPDDTLFLHRPESAD